ncbi:hypothetical protein NM688_g4354 [Phlebia brevispora]|uniref:Uncharacterized protein n=1 Tax=Phlebia brevispora TaxID=194682 RepID=A0ACC1T2V4_9APHY|nr:hypothetical protein NM688_g4354 [Phlebia brevispora]
MTSISGLMSWFGIVVTYIRFYHGTKAQGINRKKFPYFSHLQPYAAWYAAIGCLVINFFSGWSVFLKDSWNSATFVTNYFPLMFFPVLYAGSWFWYTRYGPGAHVAPQDMDFQSGLAEVEAATYEEPPPAQLGRAYMAMGDVMRSSTPFHFFSARKR